MITISLLDARIGLNLKCRELFKNEKIAKEIYSYLCDGLEECEAVPVVRCEDCKCKDKYENFCRRFLREINPSDYCSYAERKEE